MTRRVKTKKDRTFEIVKRVENENGQVDLDIRVKNRPGRKHGGPLWNNIPYPMTVQERIAEQMMQMKQTTPVEQFIAPVPDELGDGATAEFLARMNAKHHGALLVAKPEAEAQDADS